MIFMIRQLGCFMSFMYTANFSSPYSFHVWIKKEGFTVITASSDDLVNVNVPISYTYSHIMSFVPLYMSLCLPVFRNVSCAAQ